MGNEEESWQETFNIKDKSQMSKLNPAKAGPNQIQSSKDMPKTLDPELSSEPDLAGMECHSEPCPETISGTSISESILKLDIPLAFGL